MSVILWPASVVFQFLAKLRCWYQKKYAYRSKLPVIVVGNISVGGTGKTPVVEAVCSYLQKKGYHPAIISRGYGGKSDHYPLEVNNTILINECGDEPYMLKNRLPSIPIVIDPNRTNAIKYIEKELPYIDAIISDDGLQHYRIARDFEIAVIDGKRGLGNGLCLPAGPLREPPQRLNTVNAIIVNGDAMVVNQYKGFTMQLTATNFVNLKSAAIVDLSYFSSNKVHAVAGIGNPERFFNTLSAFVSGINKHSFADHYAYMPKDFAFDDGVTPVIMTQKDAVKCNAFAKDNWWYLNVEPDIDAKFFHLLERAVFLS